MSVTFTLEQICTQFGSATSHRQFLFRMLQQLIRQIEQTGDLKQAYLFGSFVTGKPNPNDLDLLIVMDSDFTTASLSGNALEVFQHERCRIRYLADLFWVTEAVGSEQIENLLDVFSRDRNKKEQPIVEIAL